jgi:hypothetical protein
MRTKRTRGFRVYRAVERNGRWYIDAETMTGNERALDRIDHRPFRGPYISEAAAAIQIVRWQAAQMAIDPTGAA